MSLKDQLAENVDPTLRDYIDAAIADAVEPIARKAALERAQGEAIIAALRRDIEAMKGGAA